MRAAAAVLLMLQLALPSTAAAVGPIKIEGNMLRLINGAEGAKGRSVWVRGQSLVLVWPEGTNAEAQVVKLAETSAKATSVKEARLGIRNKRTELELRLSERAEALLSRLDLRLAGKDLLVGFSPATESAPPATTAARPPAARVEETSSDGPAAAATTPKQDTADKQPVADKTPPPPPAPAPAGSAAAAFAKRGSDRLGIFNSRDAGSSSGSSSMWIMAILVAAGGAAAWWLKRRKKGSKLDDVQIEIVSSRQLSGKHRLLLVEAAGEMLLLGCSDKEIRLLKAVDRRKVQERQASQESEFFAEGLRMDAENAAEETPLPLERPKTINIADRAQSTARFVDRLSQQIRQREATARATKADEQQPPPLDERWAEGILKLRRSNNSSSGNTLH
jgi:flagellar biogenesis protein FliO